jgi:hypothetical protein
MMTKLGWWRYRFLELAVALIIVSAILFISERIEDRRRSYIPAASWFRVNEIFVPDHRSGANPNMIYDRTILVNFQAFWVVEVHRVQDDGLFSLACQGSDVNDYEVRDHLSDNRVVWSWFIGRECAVPEGRYRLRASWNMKRPGWPEKSVVAYSNIFRVTP